MLKWAVTKKFRDYLLGSQFTGYTDNNPLAYIKESTLGAAQNRWLRGFLLIDFDIKYRMGKLNQVADALNHCPKSSTDMSSDSKRKDEYKTISCEIVSDDLSDVIDGIKIPVKHKNEIQRTSVRRQKEMRD